MKEIEITYDEAIEFVTREEDQFYDLKALDVKGAKIQKIAVALANTDGGEFLIGIADASEHSEPCDRWQGATTIEDFNSHIQALLEISPTLPHARTILTCPGLTGKVLLVTVDRSLAVLTTAGKEVYVREGAQSIPIKAPERITELAFAKGASSFEDTALANAKAEDVVESAEITRFLASTKPSVPPLDFAVNQQLVNRDTMVPTVAGVLLFGDNPQPLMPNKCAVKIVRYETREDDPERDHLAASYTIEGPLYNLIHATVDKIQEIMSSVKIWTTKGLESVKYPPEAIWEVLVNAIIHRDYSISDDVQVLIFDNRIQVRSPGRLAGTVTVENILDTRFARNSKIVRLLHRYQDPPNRDLGEGLNTAFQKMKDWKLKSPELKVEGNYVVVTLPHTPLAKPTELILEFLESNAEITNRQARDITGIRSENLVKIEFYKLRDEGLLEMVAGKAGPKAAWKLKK